MIGSRSLLLVALAALRVNAYRKVPMYVGIDPDTDYGFEIRAFPDIVRDFTVISNNDFKCVERNKCILDGTKKVMTFLNRTIVYYDAAAQLNLIKQPFAAPFNFRFIADDVDNIGSWIGISANSTFLPYLYQQDVASGYRIIFRLTWDNELTYKTGVFEGDKNLLPAHFSAIQTINNGGLVTTRPVTVCINNRLDMATKGLSMIGIPAANMSYIESVAQNWAAQPNPDQSQYNITWSIFDQDKCNLGNLTLNYTDLYVNSTFRVKSFTPEFDNGRMCDLYTGSLLLMKYDFKYYYIEYNDGFDVRFSMTDFEVPPPKVGEVSWTRILKIVLIVLVIVFAGAMVFMSLCTEGYGLAFLRGGPPAVNEADAGREADVPLLDQRQGNPQGYNTATSQPPNQGYNPVTLPSNNSQSPPLPAHAYYNQPLEPNSPYFGHNQPFGHNRT